MTVDDAIELIFERLCAASRRNLAAELTRASLRGHMPEEVFTEAIRALRGANNDQDLQIAFVRGDPDRIVLGASWHGRCQDRSSR